MNTWLSVEQAAKETGRAPAAIRYLIKTGRLRIVRVGYHILIPRRELRKLAADAGQS